MNLSPNDELILEQRRIGVTEKELEIKAAEIANRAMEIRQQDAQRKTSAIVAVAAAVVAVTGPLATQLIATHSADKPASPTPKFSLFLDAPLLGAEKRGVYLFDSSSGRLWIAKADSPDGASWVRVNMSAAADSLALKAGRSSRGQR